MLIRSLNKDGGLIAESATELGQPAPLFDAAHALLAQACQRGNGEEDITASLRLYQ